MRVLTIEQRIQQARASRDIPSLVAALDAAGSYDARRRAAASLVLLGDSAVPALLEELRGGGGGSARRHGYIALVLAEIGATQAVPVLIQTYPTLQDTYDRTASEGWPPGGGIVDYSVDRRVTRVEPDSVPEVQLMKAKYGSLITVTNARVLASRYQFQGAARAALSGSTLFDFSLKAGAYALTRLTGRDFGDDRERWRDWWTNEQRARP